MTLRSLWCNGRSLASAANALGLPWLASCFMYCVVAIVFMPLRYQLGYRPTPIFQGGGVAWIDVAAVVALCFAFCLPALPKVRTTAATLGRSSLGTLAAIALTPSYTFVGRWFWEPAAAGSVDSSTRGSQAWANVATLALLVLFTAFIHWALAIFATAMFALPVWGSMLLGGPVTFPCQVLEVMGQMGWPIRVKCEALPAGQWYDEDAYQFFIALFSVWAVTCTLQGLVAFARARSTINRFR